MVAILGSHDMILDGNDDTMNAPPSTHAHTHVQDKVSTSTHTATNANGIRKFLLMKNKLILVK